MEATKECGGRGWGVRGGLQGLYRLKVRNFLLGFCIGFGGILPYITRTQALNPIKPKPETHPKPLNREGLGGFRTLGLGLRGQNSGFEVQG